MRSGLYLALLLMGCGFRATHRLDFRGQPETETFVCAQDPDSHDRRDKICLDAAVYNRVLIENFLRDLGGGSHANPHQN